MKVSIILPSFVPDQEVYSYLVKFLDTLATYTSRDMYQLIVIDNGSVMGSELMKERADIYIRKDYPMGYSRAANLGIALADTDYFIIANNDIELSEGWLEGLMNDYPGQGVLSPIDHDIAPGIYKNANWYSLWLIDRKTFMAVGYLDEMLNYRFMDQDYSIRCVQKGFDVMRTSRVRVKHIDSATWKKSGKEREGEWEREEMIRRYGVPLFSDWIRQKYG